LNLYEGMFLLDNQTVRADWGRAKGAVTETLAKHGAEVVSARRWDERKLAYPIEGKKRATYLLAYYQAPFDSISALRRDLELDERILRYLILRADGVPEGELEKSRAELEAGFAVPPPPADEEPAGRAHEEAPAEAAVAEDEEPSAEEPAPPSSSAAGDETGEGEED
jgi:ribosomal protein S6